LIHHGLFTPVDRTIGEALLQPIHQFAPAALKVDISLIPVRAFLPTEVGDGDASLVCVNRPHFNHNPGSPVSHVGKFRWSVPLERKHFFGCIVEDLQSLGARALVFRVELDLVRSADREYDVGLFCKELFCTFRCGEDAPAGSTRPGEGPATFPFRPGEVPNQTHGRLRVTKQELETPALLVDLPHMEANLERMASFFRNVPAKLRPHFKNHKCPDLAARQLEAGAIGMTCATLREAECLVHHGVRSVLLANEITDGAKIRTPVDLARRGPM
jgi:hypothetical protein